MQNLFDEWLKQREQQKKLNQKFLKGLRAGQSRQLGEAAGGFHDEVFAVIDCLACANCCKSIPPILNETDVRRVAKALGMRPSDFHQQYVVLDEDGDMVMKGKPCPLLQADNTCSVYESRPRACREYPHTDRAQFAENLKLHATNSQYCPAVFHILNKLRQLNLK